APVLALLLQPVPHLPRTERIRVDQARDGGAVRIESGAAWALRSTAALVAFAAQPRRHRLAMRAQFGRDLRGVATGRRRLFDLAVPLVTDHDTTSNPST